MTRRVIVEAPVEVEPSWLVDASLMLGGTPGAEVLVVVVPARPPGRA